MPILPETTVQFEKRTPPGSSFPSDNLTPCSAKCLLRTGIAAVLLAMTTLTQPTIAQPVLPQFDAENFDGSSATLTHPYYPYPIGSTYTYEVENTDPDTGEVETETIVVEYLSQTRIVAGVEARVIRDRVFSEGLIREDTLDWFAQDIAGNVWYLGEEVTDFHYDENGNLTGTTHPGEWEAGVDGALPGYIMPATPSVGDHYYEEFLVGNAEDEAEVIGVGETHTVPYGTFDDNVVHTENTTSLDPDVLENKFYAPGIGKILAWDLDRDTGSILGIERLVSVEVPEPTTATLTAIVLGALLGGRRRTA